LQVPPRWAEPAKFNQFLKQFQIDFFKIALVIALGVPVEKVVIDDMAESGSVVYWRDSNQVHHVPKRKFKELIWRG